AGLRELPVVVRDVDDTEVIELALIENLQRKDLTPFEEAEALYASPIDAATRTRTSRAGWGSRGRRSRNRSRCRRCPRRCGTFVGWPTFPPSRCCCRSLGWRRLRK